jgi:Fe-S-cluster containining protein
MNKSLPYVISQAQVASRSNPELKILLKKTLRDLNQIKNDQDQIKHIHMQIDLELRNNIEGSTCKKGCHFCCYHTINLSKEEGQLLKETSSYINKVRLDLQKKGQCSTLEDTSCVLLKNGECSNYKNRPIICRLTFVSSEPSHCHVQNEEKPISHLRVEKAAIIAGAYYMFNNNLITLPESF